MDSTHIKPGRSFTGTSAGRPPGPHAVLHRTHRDPPARWTRAAFPEVLDSMMSGLPLTLATSFYRSLVATGTWAACCHGGFPLCATETWKPETGSAFSAARTTSRDAMPVISAGPAGIGSQSIMKYNRILAGPHQVSGDMQMLNLCEPLLLNDGKVLEAG